MTHLFELAKTSYGDLLKQLHNTDIQAVSKENWSTLQSTAALIKEPSFAILEIHQKITQLRKLIHNTIGFNPQPYQELIHWMRLTQPGYRTWQVQQIHYLNDPLWWYQHRETIQKTLPAERQEAAYKLLSDLEKKWLLQSAYAHYSTLDVLYVYQTVIPVFFEWYRYAKIELTQKAHRLTAPLKQDYQTYLVWFEGALAEEKTRLRSCLHERLALGIKKGYGAWDNVIEGLRAELKAIGVLPPEPKLERALSEGHLTPEAFVTIRRIIEQEGSDAEKVALYGLTESFDKLSLFYQNYRIDAQGCRYFIPPARSDMIPLKPPFYLKLPRFLQQLFWGDVLLYTFFQATNCQFLLAQNLSVLKTPINASSIQWDKLFDHPTWKQSHACLELSRMEQERTAYWLKHVLLFLFPLIQTLLQGYQTDLKSHAEEWASKQLFMLKAKIPLANNELLTPEQQNIVKTALNYLKQTHEQWGFSSAFIEQFIEVKRAYVAKYSKEPAVSGSTALATTSLPLLPAREAFPLALKRLIQLINQVDSLSPKTLTALESQLQTPDGSHYDSVALRLRLVGYLGNTPDLPRNLVAGLQAVLDDSNFSEQSLDQCERDFDRGEEQALRASIKTVIDNVSATFAIFEPISQISLLWDQDPWDDGEEGFQVHCAALKQDMMQKTENFSVAENEKLCQYTLRFFKYIEALDWDQFILNQPRVKIVVDMLIAVSETRFSILASSLSAVAKIEKVQCREQWTQFRYSTLKLRIDTLETFVRETSGASAGYYAFLFAKPNVDEKQNTPVITYHHQPQ